jgi:hypothetical protein
LDANPLPDKLDVIPATQTHEFTQGHLARIARRFDYYGARDAVHCLWLAKRFSKDNVIARLHKDVLRHILLPMIWRGREDAEWRRADEIGHARL